MPSGREHPIPTFRPVGQFCGSYHQLLRHPHPWGNNISSSNLREWRLLRASCLALPCPPRINELMRLFRGPSRRLCRWVASGLVALNSAFCVFTVGVCRVLFIIVWRHVPRLMWQVIKINSGEKVHSKKCNAKVFPLSFMYFSWEATLCVFFSYPIQFLVIFCFRLLTFSMLHFAPTMVVKELKKKNIPHYNGFFLCILSILFT